MNYEVDQLLQNYDGFIDTKPRDLYKGKINDKALGVVNMDKSTGQGTHFTCFYNSPDRKYVYYYDSYGVIPPKNIERYLLTSGKQIAYNSTMHQPVDSVLCGYYCIYVLDNLSKGHEFIDILDSFHKDPYQNDEMISGIASL